MNTNLFQELTPEQSLRITGGRDYRRDAYRSNSYTSDRSDSNVHLDVENLYVRSGDLIANGSGKIIGSSSGGVSVGNSR